ncbi:hypothetical protein RINTHH_15040 [Richelia intracellularis HH01]|uniref:Uncharacterized protein n=1 Tax=Richelia intracellularis HH01 TaxID=1165094 RepID=M1WSU7_9NOST|nr:hypothetical protein RINTHH_15040 [Richelia intracellularis HH01]
MMTLPNPQVVNNFLLPVKCSCGWQIIIKNAHHKNHAVIPTEQNP